MKVDNVILFVTIMILLMVMISTISVAYDVTVIWAPNLPRPNRPAGVVEVQNYCIYWNTTGSNQALSSTISGSLDVGQNTTGSVYGIPDDRPVYWWVVAHNTFGTSAPSHVKSTFQRQSMQGGGATGGGGVMQ